MIETLKRKELQVNLKGHHLPKIIELPTDLNEQMTTPEH